jgi:hypothetical protein
MDPATLATTAVSFLVPYLGKATDKAVEKVGEKFPDAVGKVWNTIAAKFKGKPAEEAAKDLVVQPAEADNQAAFRKELRKVFEAEPAFAAEFESLLNIARHESNDMISNTGSGAVATHGGVAAGAGGVAVKGDVHGGIVVGGPEKKG